VPPARQGDLAGYLIARLRALNPARPACMDRLSKIQRRFCAATCHRKRERIIEPCVLETGTDAISRVYEGLTDELLARARETVAAHLQKLEREGRAACRDDVWHIIEP
jgi:hypothetical protein